jgi:predicted alpha/beta superfamily hydrolase
MKRSYLIAMLVVALPLLGAVAWNMGYNWKANSEANAYQAWAQNQKVIPMEFVVAVPKETPGDQLIYLSGSAPALGSWDGAGVAMKKGDDGKYHAAVDLMSGVEHAFKVTRGTWSTVERGAAGEETPNHTVKADAPGTVEVSVATWVDGGKTIPGRITLSGDIRQHKKFHSDTLGNDRTLVVYLPPGYDAAPDKKYPVLYMNDGQNLFDESTSFAGVEWKMDETAQALIADQKIMPIIIVGIFNSEQRTPEFTPKEMGSQTAPGRADDYANFVVNDVKSFIDKTYRTQPDREHTTIGGSSMGGLVALYIAAKHHETFSQVALLTPWLRNNVKSFSDAMGADMSWTKGDRVYVDMGGAGGANYPGDKPMDDARAFVKSLDTAGLKRGTDYEFKEVEKGEHNEAAWSKEVEGMLTFLYSTKETK